MAVVKKLPRKQIEYTEDNLIEGLREELNRYRRTGGKFSALSAKCGGYPIAATISRIACGESEFPRMSSVVLLFVALGFSIRAIRFER